MDNKKAIFALVLICIIWGTTYLFLKIGVSDMDPFFFSAIRQTSAGILLLFGMWIFGRLDRITWSQFLLQSLAGILMITLGNGLVAYAEVNIPSSMAAVICATMPVWVSLVNIFSPGTIRLTLAGYGAILLGIFGIVWLFSDSIGDFGNVKYLSGALITLLATFAWIGGSYIMRRGARKTDPFINTGIQMFTGGIGLFVISFFLGEDQHFSASFNGWFALVYLTLFGSLVAMAAYSYTLKHLPMPVVSIYAYINPVVAIILGWIFLGETMTPRVLGACLVILVSVILLNLPGAKKPQVAIENIN
ncbi:MAG: EamA family transporter [Saprospiraceae bacterium]|nr:EamA family transporter [Saprospiraceae bacterium]